MITTIVLVLSVLLHEATYKIDPNLEKYVDHFINIAKLYDVNVNKEEYTVKFSYTLPDETLAACYRDKKIIIVNIFRWDSLRHAAKQLVMVHEFGHCALDLDHTQTPDSIMYMYAIDWFDYVDYHNELLNELFGCYVGCPKIEYSRSY